MINKTSINVFIVDDDNMLIDGFTKFFNESSTINYIGRANSPEECLAKIEDYITKIDIILMDVKFPMTNMDGIQLAKKLRESYPGINPKIVFTSIGDRAIVDPQNGFYGLIPKNQGIIELMEMLESIYHEDTVYFPPKKTKQFFVDLFTPRQLSIFCLILQGKKIETIAADLKIELNTVLYNQKSIISKIQQAGWHVNEINDPRIIEISNKYQLCDELLN